MTHSLQTPYDGTARLFRIGLKPLDPAQWVDVDGRLPAYLEEKARLAVERPGAVFAAEAGTEAAQAEVLALLVEHLTVRFPAIYRRHDETVEIVPAGRRVALDAPGVPPLAIAAQLVQEDLLLMRRGAADWRLAAASLCFPSSWTLGEKIGRPMHEIHAPVPGFGPATRNAELIARMFDSLRPQMPVLRWNWSLYGDDRLFHPDAADPTARRFGTGERAENIFLRVERQTLRKLPRGGDILFTVRIYLDPLAALERQPEAARIAAALAAQLEELSAEELDYKGLTLERGRLLARLGEISA